jgi:hypothetical protein
MRINSKFRPDYEGTIERRVLGCRSAAIEPFAMGFNVLEAGGRQHENGDGEGNGHDGQGGQPTAKGLPIAPLLTPRPTPSLDRFWRGEI